MALPITYTVDGSFSASNNVPIASSQWYVYDANHNELGSGSGTSFSLQVQGASDGRTYTVYFIINGVVFPSSCNYGIS